MGVGVWQMVGMEWKEGAEYCANLSSSKGRGETCVKANVFIHIYYSYLLSTYPMSGLEVKTLKSRTRRPLESNQFQSNITQVTLRFREGWGLMKTHTAKGPDWESHADLWTYPQTLNATLRLSFSTHVSGRPDTDIWRHFWVLGRAFERECMGSVCMAPDT